MVLADGRIRVRDTRMAMANRRAIDDFSRSPPDIGAVLIMPDNKQTFEVIGYQYATAGDTEIRTGNLLRSRCVICAKPYTFARAFRPHNMQRCCVAHKGWYSLRKNSGKRPPGRPSKALPALAALSALADRLTHAETVERVAQLAGLRSASNTRRTLADLAKRGQLPPGVTMTPTHFLFD